MQFNLHLAGLKATGKDPYIIPISLVLLLPLPFVLPTNILIVCANTIS